MKDEPQIISKYVDIEYQDNPYVQNSRDTDSTCCKVTWAVTGEVGNLKELMVYKDPKTDSGKKSLKGLFVIKRDKNNTLYAIDNLNNSQAIELGTEFQPVFQDGIVLSNDSLEEIRSRITKELI